MSVSVSSVSGFSVRQLGCVVLEAALRLGGAGGAERCSLLLGNEITILGPTILKHDKEVRALAVEWAGAGARVLLFNAARGTTLGCLSCERRRSSLF